MTKTWLGVRVATWTALAIGCFLAGSVEGKQFFKNVYDTHLGWEVQGLEISARAISSDKQRAFHYNSSGNDSYVPRISVLKFGNGNKLFRWYVTASRLTYYHADGDWERDFGVWDMVPLGLKITPIYTSTLPDPTDLTSRTVHKGDLGFSLSFFGESSLGYLLRTNKGQRVIDSHKLFPLTLTTGMQMTLRKFQLEVGYQYQTEAYTGGYIKGSPPDGSDLDLSGYYFALGMRFGLSEVIGIVRRKPYDKGPDQPANLQVDLSVIDDNDNDKLGPYESGYLRLVINNIGGGEASKVEVEVACDNAQVSYEPHKGEIELIRPGGAAEIRVAVHAGVNIGSGGATFGISIKDEYNHKASGKLFVGTEAYVPPQLVARTQVGSDAKRGLTYGNADGIVNPGETIEATTVISNGGSGMAYDVEVRLVFGKGAYNEGRDFFDLGTLSPGQSRELSWVCRVSTEFERPVYLPVEIEVSERTKQYGNVFASRLPIVPEQDPGKGGTNTYRPLEPPKGTTQNANGLAVVIGNFAYRNGIPRADYAQQDAAMMKRFLIETMGFPGDKVLVYENADKATFDRLFGSGDNYRGQLYSLVNPGKTDLVVYYSGHGSPAGDSMQAYLLPSNCSKEWIDLDGYSLDLFYRNVEKLETHSTMVIVDACFSGQCNSGEIVSYKSMIRRPKPKDPETAADSAKNVGPQPDQSGKANTFAACQADEVAWWNDKAGHSVFTYAFLRGLSGAADTKPKNGIITAGELSAYVQSDISGVPAFAKTVGKTQKPNIRLAQPDLVLATFKN